MLGYLYYSILDIKNQRLYSDKKFFNFFEYYSEVIYMQHFLVNYFIYSIKYNAKGGLHLYINFEQSINNSFLMFFKVLRDVFQYKQLLDIVGLDLSQVSSKKPRGLVYVFLNAYLNKKITTHFFFENVSVVESLMHLFISAEWLEREVYEFFAIIFKNHTDMRRLLLDYGFVGFPGLKSFPQSGYIELKYSELAGSILSTPVQFSLEYRFFQYSNKWLNKITY